MLKAFANFEFGGTPGCKNSKKGANVRGAAPAGRPMRKRNCYTLGSARNKRMRLSWGLSTTTPSRIALAARPAPTSTASHRARNHCVVDFAACRRKRSRGSQEPFSSLSFWRGLHLAVHELLAERCAAVVVSRWRPAEAARDGGTIALVSARATRARMGRRARAELLASACVHSGYMSVRSRLHIGSLQSYIF